MTHLIDPARVAAAPDLEAYIESTQKNAELWRAVYRTASVDPAAVENLDGMSGSWTLLVLSEDWCMDTVSTLPVIGRLAERVGMDLRVLGRDANPDLMDTHLASGTRSIPVVMVLDESFVEWAWWGPRPATLQRWMLTEGRYQAKEDQNRRKRAWYARDRGRSTVREIIETVARAARRRAEAAAAPDGRPVAAYIP